MAASESSARTRARSSGRKAGGGFVEQKHARVVDERLRHAQAAQRARVQAAHARLRFPGKPHEAEQLLRARAAGGGVQPRERAEIVHGLAQAQIPVNAEIPGQIADEGAHRARLFKRQAAHARLAPVEGQQRGKRAQKRGLARPFAAEDAEDAALHVERDAVQRRFAAKALAQAAQFDAVFHDDPSCRERA